MTKDQGGTEAPPPDGRSVTRRGFGKFGAELLGWATVLQYAAASSSLAQTSPAQPPSADIVVTLLGTGTPVPLPDRFGPSTLVEAGGRRLLFDAGRGAPIRLNQLKVRLGAVDGVFLTHYHSDHLNGLPDVWMTSYLPVGFGERATPMRLWGPIGVARLADNLTATFSDDIRIRKGEQPLPAGATGIEAHEFHADGVVFDEGGLKVTAFEVDHGPVAKPAYGYRIDYAGRSVVISGDTRYNENVIAHGKGVDLLVHEVCAIPEAMKSLPNIQGVIDIHLSPQEAGRVFSLTKPRMAAYTHLTLLGTPKIPPFSAQDVEKMTRETYDGPLVVGEDLTRFTIGNEVAVQRWDVARRSY